ncbi:MAG: hypothetical protein VX834_03745 [Myxococcota bacterium]|nr:hypothetical protein [Myxococcota bacterium]
MRRSFRQPLSFPHRVFSALVTFIVVVALMGSLAPSTQAEPQFTQPKIMNLKLKVIHATKGKEQVPKALKKLVEPFASLGFTSYVLTDEISVSLSLGASSRVEMPNGMWMEVRAAELASNGMLKLEISSKKPKFKSRVNVGEGATIAVGGPPHENGALIFAITRAPPNQR